MVLEIMPSQNKTQQCVFCSHINNIHRIFCENCESLLPNYFYINNENYNINKFSAKDRQYDYDFISYERYIFDNQQNFHIPIGQTVTLTTDTEEFKNLIFKSSYDLDINDYKLNIETGLISERDSLLGTTFSGAFEIREAQTYFAKFKNSYDLNGDKLKFNIGYGLTKSDFKDSKTTGKAEYKDLMEGKLTLPMIFLLESLEKDKQKEVLKTVENRNFLQLKETLENSGCFEKARYERQVAINHCIEYTERFIKLGKLNELKVFLNSLLVA